MKDYDALIAKIKFDEKGLVPAITQDIRDKQVLMLAYMNAQSLQLTIETGLCHYYSRSRKRLWKKGETSGHIQHVKEIYYDCDADTLLILIEQEGPACHTGNRSCFYRRLEED
jgi:phosphoribosyl-AMP cyclohydrolase